MKNNKELKREYFKIDNDQVIYPSSVSRRFIARFLDFFLAIMVAEIIISIYVGVTFNNGDANLAFSETIYQQYNPIVMTAWGLRIFLILLFSLIIPLFNKKNPGQSLGKKMMGITPLFLSERNERLSIFIREIPVSIVFILPTIFTVILGFDVNYVHSAYTAYARDYNDIYDPTQHYITQMGTYDFIINYWAADANNSLLVGVQLQQWEVVIACIQQTMIYFFFLVFILLWISMIVEAQKRGSHDKFASTAIVDLKTITTVEQAEKRYNQIIGNVVSEAGNYQEHPIVLDDDNDNSQVDLPKDKENADDIAIEQPADDSEKTVKKKEKSTEKEDDSTIIKKFQFLFLKSIPFYKKGIIN